MPLSSVHSETRAFIQGPISADFVEEYENYNSKTVLYVMSESALTSEDKIFRSRKGWADGEARDLRKNRFWMDIIYQLLLNGACYEAQFLIWE
jgi:hypothetical protein